MRIAILTVYIREPDGRWRWSTAREGRAGQERGFASTRASAIAQAKEAGGLLADEMCDPGEPDWELGKELIK